MKELTVTFNNLLQDKRVRAEQSKYETIQRQRALAVNKYKRAYQEFLDLVAGLQSAKRWYTEMKETVESLEKNVDSFVNNRRSEGAQLLNQIEQDKATNKTAQAEVERDRLRGLMERMSMEPASSPKPPSNRPTPAPLFSPGAAPRYPQTNFSGQYQVPNSPPPNQANMAGSYMQQSGQYPSQAAYNPSAHGRIPGPASPPPTQSSFGINAMRPNPASPPPTQTTFGQPGRPFSTYGNPQAAQQQQQQHTFVPANFVPPPPPPGPPPLGPQQTYHVGSSDYYNQNRPGSTQQQQQQQQQSQNPGDPWAGLSAWK